MQPAFSHRYRQLPPQCYRLQTPETVPSPALLRINDDLARQLGLDPEWLASADGLGMLSGNALPDTAEPLAAAYAGHQFGNWNPQLGDGRALLLGELADTDGRLFDIQLKGSGRTPWSRGGDGKSPIGPVLREYIVSEAMAALGVPTTRALAAVSSGESVYRETALPGGILTRVASSHIRIGTLQYFAARKDTEALSAIVHEVNERHYPANIDSPNPPLALLESVIGAQASLIAHWQSIGFVHGVMNTDNMLLCGETVDYGPCAFMEAFDPDTVFSSIDHGGRYAYGQQPGIAHWNLTQLAQAVLPLLAADGDAAIALAQDAINRFPDRFISAWRLAFAAKLGLSEWRDADDELIQGFTGLLQTKACDFTLAFRRLYELAGSRNQSGTGLFDFDGGFADWLVQWRKRFADDAVPPEARLDSMRRANPFLIARNHQVENAIALAQRGDYSLFHRLVEALNSPFDDTLKNHDLAAAATPEQAVCQTFCGT